MPSVIAVLALLVLCGESPAPTTWPTDFVAAYRLKPGEVLRHIEPPFFDARQAVCDSRYKYTAPPGMPELKCHVILLEDDGETLKSRGASYAEAGASVWYLLYSLLDAKRYQLLIPQETMDVYLRGDWVVRRGAAVDDVLSVFATSLSRALGKPCHFETVKQRTDVIVLRGRITADLVGDRPMLNLRLSLRDVDLLADMRWIRTDYIRFFSDQLTVITGWPWIDETDSEFSKVMIRWGDDVQAKPDLPPDVRSPREQIEPLLKELQEQSGLDVKIETREITRWRSVVEK